MKKILFTLIPSGVALLYGIGKFMIYLVTGRMMFSSLSILEWSIYIFLGIFYMYIGFRVGRRQYLWLAIFGFVIGLVLFTIIIFWLFMTFEFWRDLSI